MWLAAQFLIACNQAESRPDIHTLQKDYQHKLAQQNIGQLPDSAVYEGQFENGLFHGEGTLRWRNGDVYTGQFRQGLMHGKGRHIVPELFVYEGEFVDGLWEGQGEVQFTNNDSYSGEFKRGNFDGQGLFISYDGTRFEGQFKASRLNGKGKIAYPHGGIYEGDVVDWRMQGKGTYKMDGAVYSGDFVKDNQTGNGTIKYATGDKYNGEIKDWTPHGKGEYLDSKGNRYIGEYEYGVKHGQGKMEYKSGDVYVGNFESGTRQGEGTLTTVNVEGEKKTQTGWWEYDEFVGKKPKDLSQQGIFSRFMQRIQRYTKKKIDAEAIFYRQPHLMGQTLNTLATSNPDKIDMYFVGFAAYGSQDVFMKETRFAQKLFDDEFVTTGRSVVLINNHDVSSEVPLASTTNLRHLLADIGNKMDKENDILFLYLTSHGSKKEGLDVSLHGVPLNDLPPKKLNAILQESGIKWKVVVVSACYSGKFINQLQDEYTLVMTSSRADRKSFGCSDEADFTYFGRALFKHGIPKSSSFTDAFNMANDLVRTWEKKENYTHSEPQISHSQEILKQLQAWRNSLNTLAKMARN